MADVIREEKREEIISRLEDVSTKTAKELAGEYDVLVIDPPWPMEKFERNERANQSEFDYPTMSEEELEQLKLPLAEKLPCLVGDNAQIFSNCIAFFKYLEIEIRLHVR